MAPTPRAASPRRYPPGHQPALELLNDAVARVPGRRSLGRPARITDVPGAPARFVIAGSIERALWSTRRGVVKEAARSRNPRYIAWSAHRSRSALVFKTAPNAE